MTGWNPLFGQPGTCFSLEPGAPPALALLRITCSSIPEGERSTGLPSPSLLLADLKVLAIRAHQTLSRAWGAVPTNLQDTDTIGQEQRVRVERNAGVFLPELTREWRKGESYSMGISLHEP